MFIEEQDSKRKRQRGSDKCSQGNHSAGEGRMDEWTEARRRVGIMRMAGKSADQISLWIDQRSQEHSLEGCQEREKLNLTTEKPEEGRVRRGGGGRGPKRERERKEFVTNKEAKSERREKGT